MESFVIYKKLHPFTEQQELLDSKPDTFERQIDAIKTKLLAYHNETGVPVQCVSTGPMRAYWYDAMAGGAEDILMGGQVSLGKHGGAAAAELAAEEPGGISPMHA